MRPSRNSSKLGSTRGYQLDPPVFLAPAAADPVVNKLPASPFLTHSLAAVSLSSHAPPASWER